MKRTLTNYDRLRALVRSPKYLKDIEPLRKGFSQTATQKALEEYKISIVMAPELVEKYPMKIWESTALFTDSQSVKVKFMDGKKQQMIEFEPQLFRHDFSECLGDKMSRIKGIRLSPMFDFTLQFLIGGERMGRNTGTNKKGLAAASPKSLIFLVGVEGLEPSTN